MAVSLEQFSKQLADSGVLSAQDVRALVEKLPAAEKPTDGEQLAWRLVREKKISAYQAQVVYSGKGKSLTIGSYFVLDKLGQGGMGMVLKAEHRMMKRLVAIKVLSPTVTQTKELQQRFQREVEAAARLTHPNIVGAFDAGESNGAPFLVMEYVPGDDLASIVKKNGPLSVGQAIDCIIQVARGLEFAHSQGVIHRDIKPGNLLVDTRGTVKILDMGLARIESTDVAAQADLTGSGTVMGTVDYMAPEQALSTKHADARSDLYSLGISLWFLLTARPAYDGDSLMARMLAHREEPIPSLRAIRANVPESVEAVFQKLVAKNPADRYQSATELIIDLEGCRTGVPVEVLVGAEVATGVDEFQNFMHRIDSPTMGPSPTSTRTLTQSFSSGIVADGAIPEPHENDTQPLLQDEGGKPKLQPWHQDRRVHIGVVAAALVILAVAFMFPTPTDNLPVEIKDRGGHVLATKGVRQTDSTTVENPRPAVVSSDPPAAIAPFDAAQALRHQEAWAKHLGVPVESTNSIGMKFRLIPPGEFLMGSSNADHAELAKTQPEGERFPVLYENERPQHRVRISRAFAVGKYEVTRGQFRQFVEATNYITEAERLAADAKPDKPRGKFWNENLGFPNSDEHPVVLVTWNDAIAFCEWLSTKEDRRYTLPTEAQAEFVYRAGTQDIWAGTEETLAERAWIRQPFPHAVGLKSPNPFGLYDVQGNANEWILDGFADYDSRDATDPQTPSEGMYRILRGGSFRVPHNHLRSGKRGWVDPTTYNPEIGFRVVTILDAASNRTGE